MCIIWTGGYKAIVRMSEEQPRWLQRNVDVLVQLLQSGARTGGGCGDQDGVHSTPRA
ncbi:hypothetical protein EDB83DRAFT_2417535 [Lactarius deliciosus]|nr:hypothetical protein EDB83DRAFT_2417535 [Lactarius deliciosus]